MGKNEENEEKPFTVVDSVSETLKVCVVPDSSLMSNSE